MSPGLNRSAPKRRPALAEGRVPTVQWLCLAVAAFALGFAALRHGGRGLLEWNVALLAIGLSSVGYWVVARPDHHSHSPGKLQATLVLLVPLLVVCQLLPLPVFLLKILSPERARILGLLSPLAAVPAFAPLSIAPAVTSAHLFRILGYLLLFLMVRDLTARSRRPWKVALPLIVIAAAEAAFGLVQSASGTEVSGTYPNKNHFAGLLEMCLPLAIGCAATLLMNRGSRRGNSLNRMIGAVLVFAISAMILLAITLTLSKTGFLAAIGGLFTMAALGALAASKGWTKWLTIAVLAAVFLMAAIVIPSEQLASAFGNSASDKTAEGRVPIWADTLHLAAAYPLTGAGMGTFNSAFLKYQTAVVDWDFEFAHNDYLEVAAELGIPGFLVVLAIVTSLFAAGLRSSSGDADRHTRYMARGCSGAIAAILLHSLGDFNMYIPANALALAWILGMVSGLPRNPGETESAAHGWNPLSLRALPVALGLVLVGFAPAWILLETRYPKDADMQDRLCRFGVCDPEKRTPLQAGVSPEARLSALQRDPASPFRWADLGDAMLQAHRMHEASYCFSTALALAPNIPPVKFRVADFYAAINDRAGEFQQISGILDKSTQSYGQVFGRYVKEKLSMEEIIARGMPPNPRAARAWLHYEMLPGTAADAALVWNWLLARGYADDATARDYANFLFRNHRYETSAQAWAQYLGRRANGYLTSNWIYNGDFESPLSGVSLDWTAENLGGDVAAALDGAVAHTGAQSLRLRFFGTKNVDYHRTSQTAFVKPGRYRFSAFVRTMGINTDQGIWFRIFDPEVPSRYDIATPQFTGTTDWKKVEQIVDVPVVGRLLAVEVVRRPSISIDNRIAGTAWIDTVTLSRME